MSFGGCFGIELIALSDDAIMFILTPEQHLRRISYRTTDVRLIDYRLQSTCEKRRRFVIDTKEKCPLQKIIVDIFLMIRAEGKMIFCKKKIDIEKKTCGKSDDLEINLV